WIIGTGNEERSTAGNGHAAGRGRATPVMTQHWFRPKKFGFGAVPSTWQGWVLGIVYVVVLVAVSVMLVPFGETITSERIAAWALIVVPGTAATLYIAWLKTDGRWQWRWTKRNAPKQS